MSPLSSENRKLVLVGQPAAFQTKGAHDQGAQGQALRFSTKSRTPAMPMATSIAVDTAPTAK